MKYPVICIKVNDTMFDGFKDEKSLKVASKKLVRAGVFNDVTIFDSNGSSYLIENVKELGWATPFLINP